MQHGLQKEWITVINKTLRVRQNFSKNTKDTIMAIRKEIDIWETCLSKDRTFAVKMEGIKMIRKDWWLYKI